MTTFWMRFQIIISNPLIIRDKINVWRFRYRRVIKIVIEISAWGGGGTRIQMAAVLLSDARWSSFWAQSIAMCMPDMRVKYFVIIFIFYHPPSLRKSKTMPKTAYFEGSKTMVFGMVFYFRGLGGWQKMKKMKKYFQNISGIPGWTL